MIKNHPQNIKTKKSKRFIEILYIILILFPYIGDSHFIRKFKKLVLYSIILEFYTHNRVYPVPISFLPIYNKTGEYYALKCYDLISLQK